jgi:cysteine synthase B
MSSMTKVAENLDSGVVVGIFADDGRKFKSLYVKEGILSEQEYDRALAQAKHMSQLAYQLN